MRTISWALPRTSVRGPQRLITMLSAYVAVFRSWPVQVVLAFLQDLARAKLTAFLMRHARSLTPCFNSFASLCLLLL